MHDASEYHDDQQRHDALLVAFVLWPIPLLTERCPTMSESLILDAFEFDDSLESGEPLEIIW